MVSVSRRDRLILGAPVLAAILLAMATPSDDGVTFCPFALGTGLACPGCGMTRAASLFIRGDLGAAMSYHPLIPVILAQAIVGWGWFALRRSGRVRPMSSRALNITLFGTALALLVVWGLRLAMGTLPPV
jgi:hypothetical protein